MKLIAETTGDFQIYMGPGFHVRHDRPSVVNTPFPFLEANVAASKAVLLGTVPNDATDDALAAWLGEGKTVEAFIAKFTPKNAKPKASSDEA